MPVSTIHTAAWLINPGAPPLAGGAILIRGGLIAAAGTLAELKSHYSATVVEHHDCVIVPGFVNAHTHLELTHFPSWRLRTHVDYNPRRFSDWIIQLIKICRGLHTEDFRASLVEGVRKCVESGTTAVGDIITRFDLLPYYDVPPLGGRLFFEVLGHDPDRFRDRLQLALAAADSMSGEHLFPALSPHTSYTTGEANLPVIRDAALSRSLPLAVHVSESQAESEFIFDSSGPLADDLYPFVGWQQYLVSPRHCSSTELLDRNGLLTPATLAVHCVHVNLADAQILKQRGVTVCLCPRSNERLDVGRAPLALFRKLGIPLALGTDSLASNDSLSLWEEMRFALDQFSAELAPEEVFQMGTSGGAAALGLSDRFGSLEAGKRADFQIIGHAGTDQNGLLERVIGQGRLMDVCIGGIFGSAPASE
jgi:cytosine/adenosine deaminase-related metal-dependent hydrolase